MRESHWANPPAITLPAAHRKEHAVRDTHWG